MSQSEGCEREGVFQSGQMGQTVNLLSFDFGGSNPSAPTKITRRFFAEVLRETSECSHLPTYRSFEQREIRTWRSQNLREIFQRENLAEIAQSIEH